MSATMTLDTSALDGLLGSIGDEVESAARPAAQAAAQVLYEEVQRNVSRIGSVTGNLKNSIYQAFSADNSGPGKATYHVSWRTKGGTTLDESGQRVKTSLSVAPHGHLIEFGWIQRYQTYLNKRGEFKTMVRPEMRGKKKPGRRASQAQKDAYYVLRKGGPMQHMAQPFVRPAAQKMPQAIESAKLVLVKKLKEAGLS